MCGLFLTFRTNDLYTLKILSVRVSYISKGEEKFMYFSSFVTSTLQNLISPFNFLAIIIYGCLAPFIHFFISTFRNLLEGTLHAKMAMSDSQRCPCNSYQFINMEVSVDFLGLKLNIFDNS